MAKDYYATLGVGKGASQDEIKKAFREKAHLYHPDKKGGDEAKFKEASEAYQTLSNPEKRQQYDRFGSDAGFQGGGAGGFNWQDFARQQGGFSSGGADFNGGFGDIFGDLGEMFGFGGGRSGGRRGPQRGEDIQAELAVDFLESVFGAEKTVELQKTIVCEHCLGNGAEPGSKINTCSTCGGSGQVEQVQRTILGNMRVASVCPTCNGEGKKAEKPCSRCRGKGVYSDRQAIKIKIPAGIANGQSIRLSGQGEAGERGAGAGDLYISVKVKADPRFKRQGDNILTTEKISFRQAALGDKIEVATVHGSVVLKIPDGTQTGKVFKLSGKGVPHLGGGGTGDHLVEVVVVTPTRLSRSQKKLIEGLE
ncbi:MAG: molecular chaperone DnaJ [Patescibacteria group bacterium]|jgi:molecular chaperone DnaJ